MTRANWTVTASHSSASGMCLSLDKQSQCAAWASSPPVMNSLSLQIGKGSSLGPAQTLQKLYQCSRHTVYHACFIPNHASFFLWTQRLCLGYLHPAGISLCCMYILSHLKSGKLAILTTARLPPALLGHRTPRQMNEQKRLSSKLGLHFLCSGFIRTPLSVFHK